MKKNKNAIRQYNLFVKTKKNEAKEKQIVFFRLQCILSVQPDHHRLPRFPTMLLLPDYPLNP